MRKIWMFLLLVTMLMVFSACSSKSDEDSNELDEEALENLNEEGFPIVDDSITFEMFTAKSAQNVDQDWNDLFLFNEYEDMTNIDLNWKEQVQTDSMEERRNLALGGGDLPDIFYLSGMPTSDIYKYGKQDTFVRLNDLIDDYAPNLKALMEENPEIEKGLTFPDGNIYSLPSLVSEDFLSLRVAARPWISKEVLDEVDMDVPETTDEFYAFLKAAKEETDKTPYGGTDMDEFGSWLEGAFGVANKGVRNPNVDVDPDNQDDARFYATTDNYKDMLEYAHKLFDEELIEKNIFSIEWDQYLANATDGDYASTVFYDPTDLFGEEIGSDFESMDALEGPHGDKAFTKVAPMVSTISSFIITKENPNPAAAVRWMDHFYSDDGAKLYYMGIEGETFEETDDGEFEYTDKITDSEDGLALEQEIAKYLPWLGGVQGIIKEEYFRGSENAPQSLEAADKIEPYVPDEIWPGFLYTEEENKFMNSKGADIDKYVTEMTEKFISGDEPLSNWDKYVEEIEKMGLDEYMDIQQEAYDRYKEE